MKKTICSITLSLCLCTPSFAKAVTPEYQELHLGAVHPEGWLRKVMQAQLDGLSSKMDEIYPEVMGPGNGWLGGDGDQWERGPYWIDGLVPLAYIMDEQALQEKAQAWIEWTLASQLPSGDFGPQTDYEPREGIQRTNAKDWWPKMVMLKVLQQYFNATEDPRVIPFLERYFDYQLRTLPSVPLDHWTSWATFRAADNMNVALWVYDKTGNENMLRLVDLLHSQGFDFTGAFLGRDFYTRHNAIHCVNLAQGIKEPVIYYRASGDTLCRDAAKQGLKDLVRIVGYPNGMFGGDEALHGNNPTQGSELCSAVEFMYSLEEMMKVTADIDYAEHLERIAYNALPTQITDSFDAKQYFQQVNQIKVAPGYYNFDVSQKGTANVFGTLSGYPCCISNFHQGWPKFVQNLWLRSADGGLAALCYGPSSATCRIGKVQVTVSERTEYPMDGTVVISLTASRAVRFPMHLRIPSWAVNPEVHVNGKAVEAAPGQILTIDRKWKNGDEISLNFPMRVTTSRWYENSVSVERGPLVYALRIEEEWKKVEGENILPGYGDYWYEVYPKSDWNYAFRRIRDAEEDFEVSVDAERIAKGDWTWNLDGAPIRIQARACRVPHWQEYNGMAGPLPASNLRNVGLEDAPVEIITLIPYGCTTLRITEFPMTKEY